MYELPLRYHFQTVGGSLNKRVSSFLFKCNSNGIVLHTVHLIDHVTAYAHPTLHFKQPFMLWLDFFAFKGVVDY